MNFFLPHYRRYLFALFSLFISLGSAQAAEPSIPVSIIIDDMGYSLARGQQAIALPGAFSYAFLPDAPHAQRLAEFAQQAGKDVLLHLPMEGTLPKLHEPTSLTQQMTEDQFRNILQQQLALLPQAVGVNNHMGSLLTPLRPQMDWLMQELSQRQLFFIDSRTTRHTVAALAATAYAVPFAQRDVFLDNEKHSAAIANAFQHFMQLAKRRGGAIAIAHPHRNTLVSLNNLVAQLADNGLTLTPISELIQTISAQQQTPIIAIQQQP